MAKFRFQDLEIWKDGVRISHELFDIADSLEEKGKYRFAEQLRAAAMSITNNIAEGSGSSSNKEFINFLNYSRRITFENANILLLLAFRDLVKQEACDKLLDELDILCRRISRFMAAL